MLNLFHQTIHMCHQIVSLNQTLEYKISGYVKFDGRRSYVFFSEFVQFFFTPDSYGTAGP